MGAVTEIIIEGVKKFGGEIVAGVLLAFALWMFPGLRKLFSRDKSRKEYDTEAETRRQLEILRQEERQLAHLREILQRHDEALKQAKTQTAEEIRRKSEIQRQLEEQRKEEERVKAEIQRRQEELRQAEEKRAEEARRKAELARQLEEKRREEERIRAEIQRKQEELRQAETRKAEEARKREEAHRQLEAMRKSSGAQLGYIRGFAWITILLGILLWVFTDSSHRAKITPNSNVSHTMERRNFAFKSQSKKIVSRYLETAEQGNADAQYILGLTYEYGLRYNNGDAIPKNLNEARKWYQKAAQQGYRTAQQALKRLSSKQ
ncbi:MAG: SEL1-like repeat protein [Synergistaceae bacterium]|nr:SEL1-like repeat protein [Synergistaceae bacterium]